jgi:exonuclease VII large subunit
MGGDGRVGLQATREQLEQVKDTLQLGEPHIDMVAYEQAADTLNNLIDQTYETVHHLDTDTASALVREAKETIVELGHQLVENMCKEPREQIAKTVENMLESLRGGRRVREGTIRQIKESFELMRGFDFVADQTLLNQMRECERALDSTTVQQLNASQDTGRRISRYLQDVVDQATNPEAVEEVQQQFRGIRGALNLTPEEVPA